MTSDLASKKIMGLSSATGRQIRFGTMLDMGRPARVEEGERQLGAFVLPPFQRPSVWTSEQRTRLIESIWLDLPIASYVFNQTGPASPVDMWLIDGQQRWTTILGYLASEFDVFGYEFSQLSPSDRREFNGKTFTCIQTRIEDPAILKDLYDRLSFGGTPHEPVVEDRPSPFP